MEVRRPRDLINPLIESSTTPEPASQRSENQSAPVTTTQTRSHPVDNDDGHSNKTDIYGMSLNRAFIQDVATSVGNSTVPELDTDTVGHLAPQELESTMPHFNSIGFATSREKEANVDIGDLVLPPRHLADSLIQFYWELVQPIMCCLHWPTFIARYERLWLPQDTSAPKSIRHPDNVMFYGILYVVLALGCQRGDMYNLTERDKLGAEFFGRSQKLVSTEMIDRFSLSAIQLLLLRGSYLLCSPYAERCWTVVGAAIGMAQAIGLDNIKFHMAPSDQLTREMRRRIWYTCVALDR
jgi:hypothetical protein